MAYIKQRASGKWLAEVYRHDVRVSKSTFTTREEAEAWAKTIEDRVLARVRATKALKDDTFGSVVPRRILQARAGLPIPEAEIVSTAVPATMLCGVYFLIYRTEVIYVGQSVDVFARLSSHLRSKKMQFDGFNVIPCNREQLDSLEAHYIAALSPRLNKSFGEIALPMAPATAAGYATNAEDARLAGGVPWWKRTQ